MSAMRPCVIIPTYNHANALTWVMDATAGAVADVILVDDGSTEPARTAIAEIAALRGADLVRRDQNGGKGAAVKTGLRRAQERGFTHAVQVDADGQHDMDALPAMLERARENPHALVLAEPVFDESAPKGRLIARRICIFWVNLETSGRVIHDPMCGLRIYPVAAAVASDAKGDRMEFDPEIAVRMVWAGAPVVNVPAKVRYPEDGVSNFRLLEDNLRIFWMHTRLMTLLVTRWILGPWRR